MNKIQISQKRLDKGIYWERSLELVPGCSPVSEGCIECWSARQTHMRSKQKNPKIRERYAGLTDEKGKWTGKIKLREDLLDLPLKVKKPIVWAIWNDLFHEKVEIFRKDNFSKIFIDNVFDIIRKCPQHIFLILTKRPERALLYFKGSLPSHMPTWKSILDQFEPLTNYWLGVTAENQRTADERIPILLDIPAAVRFLSIEPCLSDIDLTNYLWNPLGKIDSNGYRSSTLRNKIHWVVLGAESGSKKRLISLDAIRNVKDQCQDAGIPLFIKQIHIDGKLVKDINKFPPDLQTREFPK